MHVNVAVSPGRDIYDSRDPRVKPRSARILTVEPNATLGSVWTEYATILGQQDPLHGAPGGLAITREALPPYLLQHSAVVREDGLLEWWRPWAQISLSELTALYPNPVALDESTDTLVFVESPRMGQGFDLDWAMLLDILQHATKHIGGALTWYGGYEAIRKLIRGRRRDNSQAKPDTEEQAEVLKRIEEGVRVLREAAPRWERLQGQPYNVKEVLRDPRFDDDEKARMLGLRDKKEVLIVATVLSSDESLMRIIGAMPVPDHSAMATGRSMYIDTILRPLTFPCACKYEECSTRGSLHYTATGLKIGLDGMADHFTFPQDAIHEVMSAGHDFVLREWTIRSSMER